MVNPMTPSATLAACPFKLPLRKAPHVEFPSMYRIYDAKNFLVCRSSPETHADAIIAAVNAFYAPAGADVAEDPTSVEWLSTVRNAQHWTDAQLKRFDAAITELRSLSAIRAQRDQFLEDWNKTVLTNTRLESERDSLRQANTELQESLERHDAAITEACARLKAMEVELTAARAQTEKMRESLTRLAEEVGAIVAFDADERLQEIIRDARALYTPSGASHE